MIKFQNNQSLDDAVFTETWATEAKTYQTIEGLSGKTKIHKIGLYNSPVKIDDAIETFYYTIILLLLIFIFNIHGTFKMSIALHKNSIKLM